MSKEQKATERGPARGEAGPNTRAAASGFPLDAPEIVVTIRDRGRELVHVFAPIKQQDWIEYDRLGRVVVESSKEEIVSESMEAEASNHLWDERIVRLEGYGKTPEDWKQRVWVRHKVAAVRGLAQVFPAKSKPGKDSAEEPADWAFAGAAETTALLDAGRNGNEYNGLAHVFKQPTTKQQTEYSRMEATARMFRGVEPGSVKALVDSHLEEKIDLYDELILRVEGYEPNEPKKMDALHKRVAIEALMGNG